MTMAAQIFLKKKKSNQEDMFGDFGISVSHTSQGLSSCIQMPQVSNSANHTGTKALVFLAVNVHKVAIYD